MSDWAINLAAEYEQSRKQIAEEKALEFRNQKTVEALAPKKWADLKSLLQSKCEVINQATRPNAVLWKEAPSNVFSILRIADGRTLEGAYDPDAHLVSFRCKPAQIDFTLSLEMLYGEVSFVGKDSRGGISYPNTIDDLAYGLLNDFLTR